MKIRIKTKYWEEEKNEVWKERIYNFALHFQFLIGINMIYILYANNGFMAYVDMFFMVVYLTLMWSYKKWKRSLKTE